MKRDMRDVYVIHVSWKQMLVMHVVVCRGLCMCVPLLTVTKRTAVVFDARMHSCALLLLLHPHALVAQQSALFWTSSYMCA